MVWDAAELIGKAKIEVVALNDKQPAWHQLGIMPERAYQWQSVTEGFTVAGMMYNLEMAPCITEFNGQTINVADRRVIVREPSLGDTEPVVLDVVSNNYVLLQNEEIAQKFDDLCSLYKLATFGVLDGGRKVWVAFETTRFDIQGDPFISYLIALGNQAGGGSFQTYNSDVRVVCLNTLRRSLASSIDLMSFAHKGRVKDLVSMRAWAEQEVAESRRTAVAEWEMMVKTKVNSMQVASILEAAFPEPTKGKAMKMGEAAPGMISSNTLAEDLFSEAAKAFDKGMVAVENHRLGVAQRLNKFNAEFPQFAGTAYAVINAVTEYADWPDNPRSDTAQASFTGYRNTWKMKAWNQAKKIATGKSE